MDDNYASRQMLVRTLCTEYDIIEAENGKDALVQMHRYYQLLSAVLLDLKMPKMDGYEVLRRVRENAVLSPLPVIVVTVSEDEESRIRALSLGANDFIIKPFNPEIVKHCLHNNIALRETASILNAIQKDKLTGLYNRNAFFDKITSMIREKEPGFYILSCFDIDSFKLINDQYGAEEGDRILTEIGRAVRTSMDKIGGVASRISADNFAVLFPSTEESTEILRKIYDGTLVNLNRQSIPFSIGRYLITDTSLPASTIYDRAYIAKQSVKGRYDKHLAYFDKKMLDKLIQDQEIISEMEMALAVRQFEVWYQPQFNHATGALTGAEALVRWRHPEKGIVLPNIFIPLFEGNGFIYELDKYVWEEACAHIRKCLDEGGTPLPISVNVSRYDIFRTDFVEVLLTLIQKYNINPGLLHLEITESAFTKSTKTIVDIVKRLNRFGFIVEIDDFGSGYSSLNILKSVPAQVVKLDMRFLEDSDDAHRSGNILESVVRMTRWLGMAMIAEGVETKEQADFLKSIGCSHVQGFLYSRSLPAEEYEQLYRSFQKEERPVLFDEMGIENDDFWDPRSMDSLIFNRYVGPASVFEYHNGQLELLRANEKYVRMFGNDKLTVDDLLSIDFLGHMEAEAKNSVITTFEAMLLGGGETEGEFLFLNLPGCEKEIYIRSHMRVMASTEDRKLIYFMSENITALRRTEKTSARV